MFFVCVFEGGVWEENLVLIENVISFKIWLILVGFCVISMNNECDWGNNIEVFEV